ncbi:M20 family peptidase [Salinibacter altiplanensis]|uniref:M20 family peptidase n=1 Tax=Salinibacter altiplanensis TaxID=1803181 RepID=UPI001F47293B|nr:M20 family peptidase [Salinibacter altiplanensis]
MLPDWLSGRRLLIGTGLVLGGVLAIVAVRTGQVESRQVQTEPVEPTVSPGAPRRLAKALTIRTITERDPAELDSAAFRQFYEYAARSFPAVHSALDTTHVNGLSRLYTWRGRVPSLAPIVLMAHVDVVPIEDSSAWTHPPFEGRISDGHVWGRGALDDKASALGILEAMEALLSRDVTPRRTVHVALGHDEEVGGRRGGRALAERITAKGVSPALVVDEGGAIARGALPGLTDPLAAVGVAGKGFLSLSLTADGPGGHSSVPPFRTSIEVLNEALTRLRANPLPSRLTGVADAMFEYLAPELTLPMRTLLANRWLTAPVLRAVLNRRPATRATIRTTTVPTRLDAGVKDNVIPTQARAVVNFRILPGQSVDEVIAHVRAVLDGLSVQAEPIRSTSPPSVSKIETPAFRMMQRTIGQVTADSVVVAPYLLPGRTDSGYYADHSDAVYRFVPYQLGPDDRSRIHGPNERIAVDDYRTVVQFYTQLLRNADRLPTASGAEAGPNG